MAATFAGCEVAAPLPAPLPLATNEESCTDHMRQRYRHLIVAGKVEIVVTTAIPREMVETNWAIARVVTSPFLCVNLKRLTKLSPNTRDLAREATRKLEIHVGSSMRSALLRTHVFASGVVHTGG
ncbi:hypothetical protein [Pseudophaeobacter sp.]|uniref:hypothetical protein n=1 Tax=Pseudophaeobacter sp. TaxID=1971739 RepID=UPI00262893A7|nr:hypothetical protein [Pseudophaeobacter sp.]